METLMTLEDFHQLVLFHLINADIPEWGTWVAVDDFGALCVYSIKPDTGVSSYIGGSVLWDVYTYIDVPNNISWKDCKWKL